MKLIQKFLNKEFSYNIDEEIKQNFLSEFYKLKELFKIDKFEDYINKNFNNLIIIIHKFSREPWTLQEEILNELKIDKKDLIILNQIIRESVFFQNLITKHGIAKKYWNSIIPFAKKTEQVINNNYSFPSRIALFPGVSCMFYCGFCGRNQNAKYPLNIIEKSNSLIKNIFFDQESNNTAFSISGGLEPLTNPKLGDLISNAFDANIKIPLITNAFSLTERYLDANPGIWKLDSLRVSLYGVDADSYFFITRVKKSFEMVKKNIINFLIKRNEINKNLKFGINFIIIPENINQLIRVLELIEDINNEVKNGEGVNFLTLRDDYQSVTGNDDNLDKERKYKLHSAMDDESRMKLLNVINKFNKKKNSFPALHVDWGYSLEALSQGVLDKGLKKVQVKNMRKFGFTQLSVAIDLNCDVFLYREAGFLNREGNQKMIIGRIDENNLLQDIIKNFLHKNKPVIYENNDTRFMDSFDHVLNLLVNQSESDASIGIPFDKGPIKLRTVDKKMKLGNNWYSDDI